jgi:hypothetical protein
MTHPAEHLAAAAGATKGGDRAYAIAGRYQSLESNLRTVESFALGDGRWRRESDLRHARGGIAAASPAGRPCVAGGEAPGNVTIAAVECLTGDGWVQAATLAVPRHGVAVVAAGRTLHVIGGGPRPGLFVSDTHEAFDLDL